MTFWFVLNRLIRDVRGNTLALTAACIFPLLGLIGGGVDMSRIYLTKARMQQACDAGALAGRKTMGGGAWNANNNQAETAAISMFDANFRNGFYGSGNVQRSFVESAGRVTGTASTPLPMAIMRVFGFTSKTITVACDAEMRLPNTDVMFVLDVTGSMNETISGDTESKIVGLRRAVRCFYEIVARLDTVAECDGGAPSGGTSAETQIRFGFVPYDTNVNLKGILPSLPSAWFKDFATYQSRERTVVYGKVIIAEDIGKAEWSDVAWTDKKARTTTEDLCKSTYTQPGESTASTAAIGTAFEEFNGGVQAWGNWKADQKWRDDQREFKNWKSGNNGCEYRIRSRSYSRRYTYVRTQPADAEAVAFNAWWYHPVNVDLRSLKNGTGWAPALTVVRPTGNTAVNNNTDKISSTDYSDQTITWDGCIEERKTVAASSYSPRPTDAFDLDIDSTPTSDPDTQWAPALGQISYKRGVSFSDPTTRTTDDVITFYNKFGKGSYTCTTSRAHMLEQWSGATLFDQYVDTLNPGGATYHDIGLIWGGRLLSPTGLFAANNATTPRGGEIQRHLIFMTDGVANAEVDTYQAYGLPWWDRRQATNAQAEATMNAYDATLTQQVNLRTQAVCTSIKNLPNTTVWVVWFGASNTTIENQLKSCASGNDRFFSARSSTQLQQTFRRIANQISQLRLTN